MQEVGLDLSKLGHALRQNAARIRNEEDGIRQVDRTHFTVRKVRGVQRVGVHVRDDQWRCECDGRRTQDNPCCHILAVLLKLDLVTPPTVAAGSSWQKSDTPRNHRLEEAMWEAIPAEVPRLLARLLQESLPAL